MATGFEANARQVIEITGDDATSFLQGLITNDIAGAKSGLIYAGLLTPQGKYLFDFFIIYDGERYLLDVAAERAADLVQRLTLYKLRAAVALSVTDLRVFHLWDTEAGWPDPRDPALGRRLIAAAPPEGLSDEGRSEAWDALRIGAGIPETGRELIADESFILEAGFARLNGVDFRKGCYVGQEVTARMHHKTELRKGLAVVKIHGVAEVGAEILLGEKVAGRLHSVAGDEGLASLRYDRAAAGPLRAGEAEIQLVRPLAD